MFNKLTIILIVISIFSSCTVKKAKISIYTDPTFVSGQIDKLAVLPFRHSVLAGNEEYKINKKIPIAISKKNPNIIVMTPSEASRLLKKHGLTDDWKDFLDKYVQFGRPDTEILFNIGSKLEIDAIMQGEVADIFQRDGNFPDTTAVTKASVKIAIHDLNKGKLVWEGSSTGIKVNELTIEKAPPVIDAVDIAVDRILANLPVL